MYCNYCGSLNPSDAVYCSKCGRRTSNAEVGSRDASASEPVSPSVPPTPSETHLEETSSWRYKEMDDEELGQVHDSYQKLRVPVPQDLQSELQQRSDKRHPGTSENTPAEDRSDIRSNSIQSASKPVVRPKPKSKSSTTAYGWFIFSLICFTVCAASIIFELAAATAKGSSEDAFPKGGPFLVGVVVTAIGAKRSWSDFLLAEPEADPLIRRKHFLFLVRAVALIAAAFIAAGTYGAYLGTRSARFQSTIAQMTALGARTAPIKQRFIQLARKDTPTIPEYLQRCTDLESTLNEYEPALHQSDDLMVQFGNYVTNDPSTADVVSTMRSILQKDMQSAKSFRKEIASAKVLAALPSSEQISFYNENIKPIKDEESRIADDEIGIMKRAKARGVKLPQQMYREVGIE